MPIHFIDNYPYKQIESAICRADGKPLHGEIWVYKALMKFAENGFLNDEDWYVKHNYNLSSHPASLAKLEGQLDFVIINKYGILLIEVKGGGIEVDEHDTYFCYAGPNDRYESQNPFVQVKDYYHSLQKLMQSSPFIFRSVVFPHESNFRLDGPQLSGYKHLFFSKKDLDQKDSDFGRNRAFFDFLNNVALESRKINARKSGINLTKEQIDRKMWSRFPLLGKRDMLRLKTELFPVQETYGFDPKRVMDEIILDENFEVLKGLGKNRRTMVQGGPGTGKTILATKFLANGLIRQQKGIYFCANLLLRSRMEYMAYEEYRLDKNLISFRVFSAHLSVSDITDDLDFVIVDEAQEFFEVGLCDFLEDLDKHLNKPRVLLLYDTEQSILHDSSELDWHSEYLIELGFVHFLFDRTWRCAQNMQIAEFADRINRGQYSNIEQEFPEILSQARTIVEKLTLLGEATKRENVRKSIILVDSTLIEVFKQLVKDYFRDSIEELTERNNNVSSNRLRFTTPLKFRGLECESVIMIIPTLDQNIKIQSYVAATRAIYNLKAVIWK